MHGEDDVPCQGDTFRHTQLADHYGGLSDRWEAGMVYCSEMTGRLIKHMLGVRAEFITTLPMDTSCSVHGAVTCPYHIQDACAAAMKQLSACRYHSWQAWACRQQQS